MCAWSMCLTAGGRKTSWHRRSVCQQNSQVKPRVLGQAQHKSRQLTSRRDISKPLQYDFEQRSRQRAGRRRRSGRSVLSRTTCKSTDKASPCSSFLRTGHDATGYLVADPDVLHPLVPFLPAARRAKFEGSRDASRSR